MASALNNSNTQDSPPKLAPQEIPKAIGAIDPPNINDLLPPEILEHVFSFLSLLDRKSASLVCRTWRDLTFSKRFMRHVVLRLVDWENFRASKYKVLRKTTRRYRHLTAFFGPKECTDVQFKLLSRLVDKFGEELQSFYCLTMFKPDQLLQMVEKLPKINQLVVGISSTEDEFERPFPVLSSLKDLGSLNNIFQCPALDIPSIAPNLEHLTVNFTSATNITHSVEILKKIGLNLKTLEMFASKYYFAIDELRFPKLETLKVSGKIVDTSVSTQKRFFRTFANLRSVTFDYNVPNGVLDVLTQACPELNVLHMKSTRLKERSLSHLNRLTSLKTLGISGKLNFNLLTDCTPLPTVETFHLHMYESDNDHAVFQRFTELLPNIGWLKVTLDERITIRTSLLPMCKVFVKLQYLEIADRSFRTPKVEQNAANALADLTQLRELVLNSLDVPVAFLYPSETLRRLQLKFVVGMTEPELFDVVRKYPNLRFLQVECCRKITADGIRLLREEFPSCIVHYIR